MVARGAPDSEASVRFGAGVPDVECGGIVDTPGCEPGPCGGRSRRSTQAREAHIDVQVLGKDKAAGANPVLGSML